MLDPTLNPYVLAVAVLSGVVAAGAQATAMAASTAPWPPKRQLTGQLISTALVGAGVSVVARWMPFQVDVLTVLVTAAITGHVMGPRGLRWLAEGGVQNLRRVPGLKVPDLPPDPAELPVKAAPEESDPDVRTD